MLTSELVFAVSFICMYKLYLNKILFKPTVCFLTHHLCFEKKIDTAASNREAVNNFEIWPRGYKTFFMLNSVEHKIFPAHKC